MDRFLDIVHVTCPHVPLKGTSGCAFNSATSRIFSSGFWAHILCAICRDSDPVSPWGSGCGVNFGSFVFEFTVAGLFKLFRSVVFYGCFAPLFLTWFSHSVSRSSLRDYADSSAVDKYLSCTPEGPLSVLRPSFGARCQAFSLSSWRCSSVAVVGSSVFWLR